jgi:hypothetical protein
MVFEGNRLLIIYELLKGTELIAVETLKKKLQIINPKIERTGMDRDHLIPLKETGIIEYTTLPIPRRNKPPESVDAVRIAASTEALRQVLTEYPDIHIFHSSAYCQNMINSELVEKIKTDWKYPKNIDIEKGYRVRPLYTFKGGMEKTVGEVTVEVNKDSTLSDEQVREILRLSPSALSTLLLTKYEINSDFRPPVKADEKFETARFDEILILNLILDLRKYYRAREGIDIEINTQIKINLQIRNGNETIDLLGKHADIGKIRAANNITIPWPDVEKVKKQREELREKDTKYYTLIGKGCY